MKRRLTLALGCLTAAIPAVTQAHRPSPTKAADVSAGALAVTFVQATQIAQMELERRGLATGHRIASVVFLQGVQPGCGHYDVRIEPPAMVDGVRLRGFAVATKGDVTAVGGFRASDPIFSTSNSQGPSERSGLRSSGGEG